MIRHSVETVATSSRSPKWRKGVLSDSVAFISRFAGLPICGGAQAQALPWLRW